MAVIDWEDYVRGTVIAENLERCRRLEASALVDQRDLMQRLFELYRPKPVACLGAESMIDIPIGDLVMSPIAA